MGIVIRVSTLALSSSADFSATSLRLAPSKLNGLVTTPIVSAPCSLAISATTGAAPEPVPPPRPAVMNTMSESASASEILSRSSSAARWPIEASPPAPRPRVILSPMRILCGASDWRSAWASVLQAMNSTPIISARIIRLTALLPPPPTPMTRIRAKFSESERSGIGALPGCVLARVWRLAVGRSSPASRTPPGAAGPSGLWSIPARISVPAYPRGSRQPRLAGEEAQPHAAGRVVLVGVERVIDCHVPSASAPPMTGTLSDGPRAAAGRGPRRGRASRGGGASGRRAGADGRGRAARPPRSPRRAR